MNLRNVIEDTLDPRPIKKASLYAGGTLLEGIALGLLVTVLFPEMDVYVRCGVALVCFLVGGTVAVSAYSALKRRYKIVESEAEQEPTAVP